MWLSPERIALTVGLLIVIGIVAAAVETWCDTYRPTTSALLRFVMIVAINLVLIAAFAFGARAHDSARPELNDWMAGLHSKNKTWCCRGDDYDAIDEWETKGDRYRVKFRGQWFDVPDDAIIDGPNKASDALLWMNKGWSGMSVRCFLPGSMT